MALLKDILYKVKLLSTSGDMSRKVENITFDSRQVKPDWAFIAIKGTRVDGHEFIEKAIESGASVIVAEKLPENLKENVTYIQTANSSRALSIMASNYYGNPSSRLNLVGVTGTNGKTTIVTLLHQLFMNLGYNAGMLSTVCNKINDEELKATHTTPDAIQINQLLKQMADAGCTHCFMEASSHAIVQERVSGLDFDGAIFTNLSRDHLDYHVTFKDYIYAKKMLFDQLKGDAFAIYNADDKQGQVMVQNTKARIYSYSLHTISDFQAKVLSNSLQGLELDIDGRNGWFKLIGLFNAYNLLAVYAAATLLGEESDEVLVQLSDLSSAPGRFEQVINFDPEITGIVDYAHTPDALENVLSTIANLRTGNEKVITVVGCGGNRDKGKRPEMAEIACRYSDKVILTSDNPRHEEPKKIIEDMWKGVPGVHFKKVLEIIDRKEAIKTACTLAKNKDIILIAGKGHETYQEIEGTKYPFDDKKILAEMFKLLYS
ncbi:MAG: UDP-N-acetylmuramoyl-L-alanyl-D-glutamate--2,6-diaminopimelate ligase [Cyclobacteriaceae bacterium]